MKQLIKFGVIGTIGFIVDGSILLYLVHIENWNIPTARSISFIVAVFMTWILNRYFTFSTRSINISKSKEYTKYLIIQTIGAIINFAVFMLLLFLFNNLKNILLIPLAAGAIIAMFFNYFMIKTKLYKIT